MWTKIWAFPALATLLFLWGYMTIGYFDAEIRPTYDKHGGFFPMFLFCIPVAAIWPYTLVNLLYFIRKTEKENEKVN